MKTTWTSKRAMISGTDVEVFDNEELLVASVHDFKGNVSLVTAAPDMLDALKETRDEWEDLADFVKHTGWDKARLIEWIEKKAARNINRTGTAIVKATV